MKRCVIITGGTLDLDFAGNFLKNHSFEKVIAVDAGLKQAEALGVTPDLIVGDFDTVDPEVLARFRAMEHMMWDVHQPEKDETDTELAVTTAVRAGCRELVILGALGGRFDHALGNVHLLYYGAKLGAEASILDSRNRITVLTEGRTFRREELWGKYVSFLPLTMEVKGITLRGFKYPLTKKDISIGPCLCISNELAEEEASITFDQGVLICVESRD